jgi:hypothetical protein
MFMATIANDLFRLVQGTDGRACTIWQRLHGVFFAHQSPRYKIFRTTPRGDLGISAYGSRLQAIADDLANIVYPVANHDLTMQFLAGLGGKFRMQTEMIENTPPLPSFADVFSCLLLDEYNIDHNQQEEGAHAMAVHGGPAADTTVAAALLPKTGVALVLTAAMAATLHQAVAASVRWQGEPQLSGQEPHPRLRSSQPRWTWAWRRSFRRWCR